MTVISPADIYDKQARKNCGSFGSQGWVSLGTEQTTPSTNAGVFISVNEIVITDMETSTSAGFGGDSAQGVAAAGVSQRDVAASGGEEASDYGGMALESIRVAAETVGIAQLNEEAAKELAEEVSFRWGNQE